MPESKGPGSALGSGVWISAADCNAAAAAPGASLQDQEVGIVAWDGAVFKGPKLKKNCPAMLGEFSWKLGGCAEAPKANDGMVDSAMRFGGLRAIEFGFLRNGPRVSRRRPGTSFLGAAYPSAITDGARR